MSAILKKSMMGGMATLVLGLSVATISTPAAAGSGWVGPAAAGAIGGFALGAILSQPHSYYGGSYGGSYYPAYSGYGPYYSSGYYSPCHWQRQPIYDDDGEFYGYRRVRACY